MKDMHRIRCIVIDDEPLARQIIREYLQKHPDITIISEHDNPIKAYSDINSNKPDLLFLDIQMPGLTGFELLNELDEPPVVIFCTAYDEYAIQAFEANAIDYLLKPFDQERFDRSMEKARQFLMGERVIPDLNHLLRYIRKDTDTPRHILVKDANQLVMVSPSQIYWVEAQEDYSLLHTMLGNFLVSRSMQQIEQRFADLLFRRIHRSALVNFEQVKKIEPWSSGRYLLIMKNGDEIESSKAGAKLIKEMLL